MLNEIYLSDKEREYHEREAAFAKRTDCLCEDTPPCCVDCFECPAYDDCIWLSQNEPYRNAGK